MDTTITPLRSTSDGPRTDRRQRPEPARLFDFLRIQSISTDPAYAPHCRAAAEFVAKDLASLGFETSVRPTQGHPVVIGKAPNGSGPRILFYGHYDVSRRPADLGKTPVQPRIADLARRPQKHRGPRSLRRQRPGDDLPGSLPCVQSRDRGKLPLPITMTIERPGGVRFKASVRLRAGQRGRTAPGPGASVRHQHVGLGPRPRW